MTTFTEETAMRAMVQAIVKDATAALGAEAVDAPRVVAILHARLTPEMLGCGVPSPDSCEALVSILALAVHHVDVDLAQIKDLCFRVRDRSMYVASRDELERTIEAMAHAMLAAEKPVMA